VIREIVQEVELLSEQRIELALDLPRPIRCDPLRMGQLLSNLLGNAVTHGAPGQPIRVDAADRDGTLRLAVTNHGPPIPEELKPSLFLPFSRGGGESPSLHGLGLGLYIAAKIARAHEGQLEVESTEAGTTFALTMPARHE
jgi:signal transduction histidine kinase